MVVIAIQKDVEVELFVSSSRKFEDKIGRVSGIELIGRLLCRDCVRYTGNVLTSATSIDVNAIQFKVRLIDHEFSFHGGLGSQPALGKYLRIHSKTLIFGTAAAQKQKYEGAEYHYTIFSCTFHFPRVYLFDPSCISIKIHANGGKASAISGRNTSSGFKAQLIRVAFAFLFFFLKIRIILKMSPTCP